VQSLYAFDGVNGSFDCTWADDIGPAGTSSDLEVVTVTVSDDDSDSDSDTLDVTVNNVKPVITAWGATYNQAAGDVNSTMTFTDVGAPDTETASFKYTWTRISTTGTPSATQTNSHFSPASTSTVADTFHLAPGCYAIQVEMFVTDDDSGVSDSRFVNLGSNVDFPDASFRAPIMGTERNIAKWGNVVPIKVVLTSICVPGAQLTTPPLYVTAVKTSGADDLTPDDTNVVVENVNNPDTNQRMRNVDSMYMYNLATKNNGFAVGVDYTIRIRAGNIGGPIILKALFQPKK
jgi:hypothetical protein